MGEGTGHTPTMAESSLHKNLKHRALCYLQAKGYRLAKVEVNGGYYGIYDAWGINNRTFDTIGIEVKVSRSDWRAAKHKERMITEAAASTVSGVGGVYLNWLSANETYILCPSGLIRPEEISPACGLLWFDGNRIRNVKKPRYLRITLGKKIQSIIDIAMKYDFSLK